jgi:hypothetical protein
MHDPVETHRETVLESPYSRDREEAIEELGRVYTDVGSNKRRRILETLRQVAHESSHRDERDMARETMVDCFAVEPASGADVVVPCFADIAERSKFSEERLAAIDRLRRVYPDVGEAHRETIGQTLAEIAGNAIYEDERRRARQRLSDITAEERTEMTGGRRDPDADTHHAIDDAVGYLGRSLAEHLENAATDSPEECRQRAVEVRDFLLNTPVDDTSYEDIYQEVDDLVDQLAVIPTDDSLDEDRIERVQRTAVRIKRLYGLK